jgi:hypothetical protein
MRSTPQVQQVQIWNQHLYRSFDSFSSFVVQILDMHKYMKDWFEEQKQAGLEDTPEQVILCRHTNHGRATLSHCFSLLSLNLGHV